LDGNFHPNDGFSEMFIGAMPSVSQAITLECISNRLGMKQPRWIRRLEAIDDEGPSYWVVRGWSKGEVQVDDGPREEDGTLALLNRKCNDKTASLPWLAACSNPTPMSLDDFPADGQADARAFVLAAAYQAAEWFEQLVCVL
jgi:hypothetical protein